MRLHKLLLISSLYVLVMILAHAFGRPGPDSNYNIDIASGGGCSQATAFLARTSGLSGSQQTAYQNLICGEVTDGTFALLDWEYVFATSTTANADLNLISSSYTPTINGTETFAAYGGYTGDGSSGWINSNYNLSTSGGHFAQNSATVGACQLNSRTASNQGASIGGSSGTLVIQLNPLNSGDAYYPVAGTGFPGFANTQAQGSFISSRTSSAGETLYINGSSVATSSDTSAPLVSVTESVGAENNGGGGVNGYSTDQIAYSFSGGGMTGTQVTAMYNRLHTFLSAIGAPSGCYLFVIVCPLIRRKDQKKSRDAACIFVNFIAA
jgi:hypothetical protein